MHSRESDGWTIGGTVLTALGVGFSLAVALLWVGWYVSKADSAISNVQSDVGQIKEKVQRLTDDSAKQSTRIERIEMFVGSVEANRRAAKK